MNSGCKHSIQVGFIWHFVNIICVYKSYQMNHTQKINLGASKDAQLCVRRDQESLCTTGTGSMSQVQNNTDNSLLPYYCLTGITSMKLWAGSCLWNGGREILINTGTFTHQFWKWFYLKSSSKSFHSSTDFLNKFYNGLPFTTAELSSFWEKYRQRTF